MTLNCTLQEDYYVLQASNIKCDVACASSIVLEVVRFFSLFIDRWHLAPVFSLVVQEPQRWTKQAGVAVVFSVHVPILRPLDWRQ